MSKFDTEMKAITTKKVKGKWPEIKHNYTSSKYGSYVYNISVNGVELWTAKISDMPPGSCWNWRYYSKSEDDTANKVYRMLTKYLKRLSLSNRVSGGHFIRHKTWIKWVDNYIRVSPF